jgi:2-keto-4-pentenoate hydratase
MPSMSKLEDAVTAFVAARAMRPQWPGVPDDARPATIDAAYRLQQAIHARLAKQGIARLGYKIGSSSAASQRPFGLTEPVYGGICTDTHFDTLAAAFARPMRAPSLECEIVFRLRADIDGADPKWSTTMIADAIGACHIGCEIIDRRYDDPDAVGVPSLIADDFFHVGFVLGAANPDWRALDLATLDGAIEIDGARETGNAADTLDALTATLWLARKLAAAGTKLHAGEIILTGTLPRPTPITLPARAVTLSITGFAPLVL